MKNYYFILIFSVLLLSFPDPVQAQHGVSPDWGPEIKLPAPPGSGSIRGFLYSNMGVLSNGRRVIVLNRQDGKQGPYVTYSDDGIVWSTPVLFAPDTLVIGLYNLKMIAGPDDRLHFVWASHRPEALYYSQMNADLQLLLDSVRIADNPDFHSFDDMYISTDRRGRLHIMWDEGRTGEDLPEIYYSKSEDGGKSWKEKQRLSNDDGMPSSFPRGQFSACNGDTIAIVWRDSTTAPPMDHWNLQMVLSFDAGDSWTSPVFIRPSASKQMDPDLVIDPWGRFHLFYHEVPTTNQYWDVRVKYAWSDDLGQNWYPESNFLTLSREQRSHLVEGSRYDYRHDVLWTFWKEEDLPGKQGGDMLASYSLDRGQSWSEPEYVSDHGDTSIGYKSVDLLPDGGVAVNYELPNYPEEDKLWVFYRERAPVSFTGLAENQEDPLRIYPNPFHEKIIIENTLPETNEILLFDLNGRLLFSKTLHDVKGPVEIEGASFPPGIYLLEIRSTRKTSTQKIIKL